MVTTRNWRLRNEAEPSNRTPLGGRGKGTGRRRSIVEGYKSVYSKSPIPTQGQGRIPTGQ